MEDADFINYDTDRLRIELEQEKQMKEMLEQSASELRNTVADLEKRLNNVEDEGNEWKTRFETLQELNRQLERQVNLLQDKMENICGNPADRLSSIRSYDEMPVILKQLEMDKNSLQNQLKDYALRIEQEAKAYHKANDERRAYLTEISQKDNNLLFIVYPEGPGDDLKCGPKEYYRQASTVMDATKKQQVAQARGTQGHHMMTGNFNVANNRRVLHPKKGPIKKTAAVTRLPKLKC